MLFALYVTIVTDSNISGPLYHGALFNSRGPSMTRRDQQMLLITHDCW